MRHPLPLAALAALLTCGLPAWAEAAGPDLVTVSGAVSKPDRPTFNAFRDAAFAVQGVDFEAAKAFDWDELTALPQASLTTSYANWPGPVTVQGPLLRDVLAAAGARGETVTVSAVDGYSATFPMAEVQARDMVLALEADGAPLALGGRGPAWLVFAPGSVKGYPGTDDAGLVWAVTHIAVK